jgi:predicted RNA binding protein YcfA (HicA-like mRNA interferase family)
MKFKEIERIITQDGWQRKKIVGSHYHYKHPTKEGKVTIPHHGKDINPDTIASILKQAGLKRPRKEERL